MSSDRHSPAEWVATEALERNNASLDPATILLLAKIVIELIHAVRECRKNPTAATVRKIATRPNGVQWTAAWARVRRAVGLRKLRQLGGRNLIDAGFAAAAQLPDADLSSMLHLGGEP